MSDPGWFVVSKDGQRKRGPFSAAQIITFCKQSKLKADSFLMHEQVTQGKRVPASAVKQLRPHLSKHVAGELVQDRPEDPKDAMGDSGTLASAALGHRRDDPEAPKTPNCEPATLTEPPVLAQPLSADRKGPANVPGSIMVGGENASMKLPAQLGCGCLIFCAGGLFVLVLLALPDVPNGSIQQGDAGRKQQTYKRLNRFQDANGSIMQFYLAEGRIDANDAVRFSSDLRSQESSDHFFYAVFVDDERFARPPNNPFTALFGLDESMMKHVLAYYELSPTGFSELNVYYPNMLRSMPETYVIR